MARFARLVLSFTYVLSTIFLSTRALAFELEFVTASPQIYAEPHDLVLSPDRHSLYVADLKYPLNWGRFSLSPDTISYIWYACEAQGF